MKTYILPVCFWCGQGFNAPDCSMVIALSETHAEKKLAGGDKFSSDLPKERLHKKAKSA